MKHGGDGESQDIERLAVAGVKIGKSDEIATDASPEGMEERKRGESRNVKEESGGVIGLGVDGGLILHTLENTESNARHESVIDQRLG